MITYTKKDLYNTDRMIEMKNIVRTVMESVIKNKEFDPTLTTHEQRLEAFKLSVNKDVNHQLNEKVIMMFNVKTLLVQSKHAKHAMEENIDLVSSKPFRIEGSLVKYSLLTSLGE